MPASSNKSFANSTKVLPTLVMVPTDALALAAVTVRNVISMFVLEGATPNLSVSNNLDGSKEVSVM